MLFLQALTVLNHTGVCLSYRQTWSYLKQISLDIECYDDLSLNHYLWIYDNLNIHHIVRHKQEGNICNEAMLHTNLQLIYNTNTCIVLGDHNKMENTTTRLAVQISKLPDWEFSWEDTTPRGSCKNLTEEDILANEEDGLVLYELLVKYVCTFIAHGFDDLTELRVLVDPNSAPRVKPSVVIPMKILFHDEKYADENILILQKLAKDVKMTGIPQVSLLT